MAETYLQRIDHPSAWRASDLASLDDITVRLDDRHIDAFEAAYAAIEGQGLTLDEVEARHFRVPEVADDLRDIYREVMDGRGIVLVDRLPVEDWPLAKAETIYWGIGTHFGRANSQSVIGDRLGHVVNVGGKDPNERAYRNSRPLKLHTDACDMIAMLSIRKAAEGGESQYASALTVHNILLDERPELLAPLYRGFRYHRFGEEGEGEAPVTEHLVPVLSRTGGFVSTRYIAAYIHMAYEELGEPLSQLEREALEAFDEAAQRPDVRIELMQEPGQLLLCNNYTVLHARSGFEDDPAPGRGRLLLRLWLTAHDGDRRPIDPHIEMYRTGGIEKREGRADTYYRGRATEVLKAGPLNY